MGLSLNTPPSGLFLQGPKGLPSPPADVLLLQLLSELYISEKESEQERRRYVSSLKVVCLTVSELQHHSYMCACVCACVQFYLNDTLLLFKLLSLV